LFVRRCYFNEGRCIHLTSGSATVAMVGMSKRILNWAEYRLLLDQEVGVTDWIRIDQSRIDAFADATLDHQHIHVDPERAKQSLFGTARAEADVDHSRRDGRDRIRRATRTGRAVALSMCAGLS